MQNPEEPEEEPLQFVIYPNPVTRSFVTIKSPEEIIYGIFNLTGQRLTKDITGFAKKHEVDITGLRPGMYIVRVQNQANQQTGHKLVIQ
jgi:hypothetical protein